MNVPGVFSYLHPFGFELSNSVQMLGGEELKKVLGIALSISKVKSSRRTIQIYKVRINKPYGFTHRSFNFDIIGILCWSGIIYPYLLGKDCLVSIVWPAYNYIHMEKAENKVSTTDNGFDHMKRETRNAPDPAHHFSI